MTKPGYRRGLHAAVILGLFCGTVTFVRLNGWAWGERPFELSLIAIAAIATVLGVTVAQLLSPLLARVWLGWRFWAILLPWVYISGIAYTYVPLDYAHLAVGVALSGLFIIVRFAVRPEYDISRD